MKLRTFTYWRTNWINGEAKSPSLEEIVSDILQRKSSVVDSSIKRPDGSVLEVRHRNFNQDGAIFLHLAGYQPGAEGSVVPNVTGGADQGALASVPPPNNANFLGASMVAMIAGNHCLFCSEGATIGTLRYYIQSMSRQIKRPSSDEQFELVPVPNRNVIKQLEAKDVISIGLDVTLDEYDNNESIIETETRSLKQQIIGAVRDVFEKDENIRILREKDLSNVNAKVSLNIDRRKKGGISQSEFDTSARDIMDDLEPGFYLKLKGGTKITHQSMKISKSLPIPNVHEALDHNAAWLVMEEFYTELRANGYI